MITKEQIRLAKNQWEQAHAATLLAHECYALLIKSRNALRESYQEAGFPPSKAAQDFENLMEEHSARYKAALEHMEKMESFHQQLLERFESASS